MVSGYRKIRSRVLSIAQMAHMPLSAAALSLITKNILPESRKHKGRVHPVGFRAMPFGVRLLSPSSSTSRFDPLPMATSNFFGWTMPHKMIPSLLWRNTCLSKTSSYCTDGGNSTIKQLLKAAITQMLLLSILPQQPYKKNH